MNVLLPIETISRELDYKLLLAHQLAGVNSRKMHIGSFQFLDKCLKYFSGGLYIGKNIFRNDARRFKPKGYYELKRQEIDSIYYYEEGGFYADDETLFKNGLEFGCNPSVFDENDYIFVWGEKQKQTLSQAAKFPENIKNVGVLRFDLYQKFLYLYENKMMPVDSGEKYILVNTHNGFSNNHNSFKKFTDFCNYPKMTAEARIEFLAKHNYDANNLHSVIKLVLYLADKIPNTNFIIRPHPSENITYYQTIFKNINNVKIIREGSVGAWLDGAEALIHAGCTTSFEAHFSGVPVITFIKEISSYSIYPANSIGYITSSNTEALEIINTLREGKNPGDLGYDYQLKGEEVINNLKEPALELFLKEYEIIEGKYLKRKTQFKFPSRIQIGIRFIKDYLFLKIYFYINLILGRRTQLNSILYNRNKNPGFDQEYILAFMDKLEKKTGKKVNVTFHNANYFVVD